MIRRRVGSLRALNRSARWVKVFSFCSIINI
jgi:hypothetical protein